MGTIGNRGCQSGLKTEHSGERERDRDFTRSLNVCSLASIARLKRRTLYVVSRMYDRGIKRSPPHDIVKRASPTPSLSKVNESPGAYKLRPREDEVRTA